jgi:hypothetical protein
VYNGQRYRPFSAFVQLTHEGHILLDSRMQDHF